MDDQNPLYPCPECFRRVALSDWIAAQIELVTPTRPVGSEGVVQAKGLLRCSRRKLTSTLIEIKGTYEARCAASRKGDRLKFDEAPNAYLLREVYKLSRQYRDGGKLKIIKRVVEDRRMRSRSFPKIKKNPFRWTLVALQLEGIDTSVMRRWSNQLIWADKNNIEPAKLEAKLRRAGKAATGG